MRRQLSIGDWLFYLGGAAETFEAAREIVQIASSSPS
jgi:hypothetical protein